MRNHITNNARPLIDNYLVKETAAKAGRARIEEYACACAQEGFGVDRARYFAGHDQSLGYYCKRGHIDSMERSRHGREQRLRKAQSDERHRLSKELYDMDQNLRRERDALQYPQRGIIWKSDSAINGQQKKASRALFFRNPRLIIRRTGRAIQRQGESHEIPLPRHHHR